MKGQAIRLSVENAPVSWFGVPEKLTFFGFTALSETTIKASLEAKLPSQSPTRSQMIQTLQKVRSLATVKSFFAEPLVYHFLIFACAFTPLMALNFLAAPLLSLALARLAVQICGVGLMALGITMIKQGTQSIAEKHSPTFSSMYKAQAMQAKNLIEAIEKYPDQQIQMHIKEPFADGKVYVFA